MNMKLMREGRLSTPVVRLALSREEDMVACATQGGQVCLLRRADLEMQWTGRHGGPAWRKAAGSCIAYASDGAWLASGSFDGSVVLWAKEGGRPLLRIPYKSRSWVLSLSCKPGGDALAIGRQDGMITIWDLVGNREQAELLHDGYVTAVQYDSEGERLVSAGFDRRLRLWDATDCREVWHVKTLSMPSSASFGSDGKSILANGFGEMARIISTDDCTVIANLTHEDEVLSASFCSDGRRIVTTCRDLTVGIWDAKSYQRLETLSVERPISDVALCSNEDTLILSAGTILQVWSW
jgi:WD40 repeat protein